MAVVNIREVYTGVSLGLWQMDETVEQLFEQYSHLQAYRSQLEEKYKNDGRKLDVYKRQITVVFLFIRIIQIIFVVYCISRTYCLILRSLPTSVGRA